MELSNDQALAFLKGALGVFQDSLGIETTVMRLLIYLEVAENPNVDQYELDGRLGLAKATVARNILDLTKLNSRKLQGPDVIKQLPSATHRRQNVLALTGKGESLLEKAIAAGNKEVSRRK